MKTLSFVLGLLACGGAVATDPPVIPGRPPAPPVDGAPASSVTETFVVDALFLGDQARDATAPDDLAWRAFGYDLDHLHTTKDSTNVCTPVVKVSQIDGEDGIDNAWGSSVVPELQTLTSSDALTQNVSSALANATPLDLAIAGLLDDPSASAVGLSLVASFEKSATHFGAAYVSHGIFVSGAGDAPLMLAVPFVLDEAPVVVPLVIHDALVTFSASGDAQIAGTIAGVLDLDEITTAIVSLAKSFGLTGSFVLDGVATELAQSVDILMDGTNRVGVACDGISIGLGFSAHRVP